MNKQTYRSYRECARANGVAYALRAHGLDMYDQGLMFALDQQDIDLLRSRQLWMAQRVDSPAIVIRCTSILTNK